MTLEEFKTLLERTTLPCAFDHFKTPQSLPYLIYLVTENSEFSADNVNYHTDPVIQVELYTEIKNQTLEETVENVLGGFFFTKDEGYLSDEQMYLVTYQLTL